MRIGLILPWVVIVLFAVGLPVLTALEERPSTTRRVADGADIEGGQPDTQMVMMGRYTVGMNRILQGGGSGSTRPIGAMGGQGGAMMAQVEGLATTPSNRVAAAVLAGELLGNEEAVRRLEKLGMPDAAAFSRLYEWQEPLPQEVKARYGYFADLAEVQGKAPTDTARQKVVSAGVRTMMTLVSFLILLGFFGLVGLVLLVIGLVKYIGGTMVFRTVSPVGNSDVYVQSFALYLVLYFGASTGLGLIGGIPLGLMVGLLAIPVAMAACYPLLRGVTVSKLQTDWGIHRGGGIFKEIALGLVGYMGCLPIIAVGFGMTLLLSRLMQATPSHPVTDLVANQPWTILLLASVFAPITEELMFRGAFVSHCRRYMNLWGSGLLTSVVFAAIHPQGWAAIPVLTSVGLSLSLLRQWRGSLIAPIAAHCLNNTTVLLLVLLMTV